MPELKIELTDKLIPLRFELSRCTLISDPKPRQNLVILYFMKPYAGFSVIHHGATDMAEMYALRPLLRRLRKQWNST